MPVWHLSEKCIKSGQISVGRKYCAPVSLVSGILYSNYFCYVCIDDCQWCPYCCLILVFILWCWFGLIFVPLFRLVFFLALESKYLIVLPLQCACLDLHLLGRCLMLAFVSPWEQMAHHQITEWALVCPHSEFPSSHSHSFVMFDNTQ